MKTLTIDECFYQIRNGANIKQGVEEGGYPITRIETIANGRFNRERMGYAGIIDLGKYESYLLEDGDLLMSHINSIQYLGRTVLYKRQGDEKIIHGMNLLGLKADKKLILPEYAKYYFCSSPFRKQISKITKKSVNQASFAVTDLKKVTLELPALFEQECIANTLNKINKVIYKYQQQLQKIDELIKSRFVELFGTIHDNRFGYSVVTLQDVSAPIKDGTHQTPTYTTDVENGYKFLSSKDVTTGKVDWSHLKYIPEELHRELYARISPREGDILLAKNGTTGIAAIVDRDEVFDIYVSLALIRPHGVDPTYLWAAINAAETKQQFDASLKGIGVPNLHLGEIKKARIILPPMELQRQFAAFVEQVDKSKVAVQKSLDETQLLFNSLMQKYFG